MIPYTKHFILFYPSQLRMCGNVDAEEGSSTKKMKPQVSSTNRNGIMGNRYVQQRVTESGYKMSKKKGVCSENVTNNNLQASFIYITSVTSFAMSTLHLLISLSGLFLFFFPSITAYAKEYFINCPLNFIINETL